MPKGTLPLLGVLIAALAFWFGWQWWQSTQKPDVRAGTQVEGSVVRLDRDNPALGGRGAAGGGGRPIHPADRHEEGEILVVNPPDRFDVTVGQMGYSVLERIRLNRLQLTLLRLRVPSGQTALEARQALGARFPGLIIDVNQQYELQSVAEFKHRLPRSVIGWRPATPGCGAGIRLGMIDAPVDTTHEALAGAKIEYRSFHNPQRRLGPADHGTAVAAILIGKPEWGGLLPGAELKAANMFELNETGSPVGNAMGLLKAMDWLIQEKLPVINMSVAGGDNKVVRTAVDIAGKQETVVIAAAGNWGGTDRPAFPAAYDEVIAVTAFGENRVIYSQANRGQYIDLAAPGVEIYTAVPRGGRIQSGTSFAAPFVSVLVALQVAGGTAKNQDAVLAPLRQRAIDLGPRGKDDTFGWGFIDLQPNCR